MPWNQTTHSKIAMPMTAASVAQRRMGFKAPRAQKNEGEMKVHGPEARPQEYQHSLPAFVTPVSPLAVATNSRMKNSNFHINKSSMLRQANKLDTQKRHQYASTEP